MRKNIVEQNKEQSNLSVSLRMGELLNMDLWTHYSVELFFFINFGAVIHPSSIEGGVGDWVMA